jgi:1,4-dihydroxy-2-naphthoyl-CoA synthase
MQYEDILYDATDGVATITMNRPDKLNAFRGQRCEELIHAFHRAGWDKSIGVIVLTGAGDKAFCTGGDQSGHAGSYDGRGTIGLPIEEVQTVIRDVPKPVIAPALRLSSLKGVGVGSFRLRTLERWRTRSRKLAACPPRRGPRHRRGRIEV